MRLKSLKVLLALIGLLASVLVLQLVSASAPASARQQSSRCTPNLEVCFTLDYSKDGNFDPACNCGVGFTIHNVNLECNPNAWSHGWDHPAVDGHDLSLTNAKSNQVWGKDDAHSNVDTSDTSPFVNIWNSSNCSRTMSVEEDFPSTHYLYLDWLFTEQINLGVDRQDSLHLYVENCPCP